MSKNTAAPALQVFFAMPETTIEPTVETSIDVPATSLEVRPTSLELPAPKSSGELAAHYSVSDKAIQFWFKVVRAAYCWLNPTDLQVGTSNKIRYTPLCQELLADFRNSGMSREQWIASIHAANADKLNPPTAAPEPPLIEPEMVVEPAPEASSAIVVPQSHIHLLDDNQQSELALIHSLYVKPEPTKTFQSIELNGDQATILEGLKILHSTVSQMKSENDRIKADTSKRKSDIELANEAIVAIAQEGKKAVEENFELVAEAQAVQAVETDAKKRLAQLLKALGEV